MGKGKPHVFCQYWRPISPSIRTAPFRSICHTLDIAVKSLSSPLRQSPVEAVGGVTLLRPRLRSVSNSMARLERLDLGRGRFDVMVWRSNR